jgi:hypothetical protein
LPPAILHVSHESRTEAKLFYKLVDFEDIPEKTKSRQIWFNPSVDIVYLGDEACIATLLSDIRGPDIRRIAIASTGRFVHCHDWDYPLYGVDNGINVFQALQGFHKRVEPFTRTGYVDEEQ